MILWTWGKGLEDAFDGKNRRNLRDFIQRDEKSRVTIHLQGDNTPDSEIEYLNDGDDDAVSDDVSTYYYVDSASSSIADKGARERQAQRRELARIPTCAVFHKLTEGSGVPHSFIGLIRQWPALPEVLVSAVKLDVDQLC